jgi:hypothetical protein
MILGKKLKNKIDFTLSNFIEMVDYSMNNTVNDLLLEKLSVTTYESVNISVWDSAYDSVINYFIYNETR